MRERESEREREIKKDIYVGKKRMRKRAVENGKEKERERRIKCLRLVVSFLTEPILWHYTTMPSDNGIKLLLPFLFTSLCLELKITSPWSK